MASKVDIGDMDVGFLFKKSFYVLLFILAIVLISFSWFTANVQAGYAGVKFDSFNGGVQPIALQSGFQLKAPWVSIIEMNVQTQKSQVKAEAASSDLQVVSTEIAVNYRLIPSEAPKVYREIGVDYADKLIAPTIQDAVKAATAKYKAEELIANRDRIRQDIDDKLKTRFAESKFMVFEGVNIVNFDFSADYNAAIEAKVVQEQSKQRSQIQLDQSKIDAQQKVVQAEADAQATVARAQAQANATVLQAQADAQALRLQRQELTGELVALRAVQKWNGVLPQFTGGGAIPFLNVNTS